MLVAYVKLTGKRIQILSLNTVNRFDLLQIHAVPNIMRKLIRYSRKKMRFCLSNFKL